MGCIVQNSQILVQYYVGKKVIRPEHTCNIPEDTKHQVAFVFVHVIQGKMVIQLDLHIKQLVDKYCLIYLLVINIQAMLASKTQKPQCQYCKREAANNWSV